MYVHSSILDKRSEFLGLLGRHVSQSVDDLGITLDPPGDFGFSCRSRRFAVSRDCRPGPASSQAAPARLPAPV